MTGIVPPGEEALKRLVDDYRGRCLWFVRAGYYPETREEVLRVLDAILSPATILEEARRTARCSDVEIRALDFGGQAPDARELARIWRAQLESARLVLEILPAEEAGRAVLDSSGRLFRGGPDELRHALLSNQLIIHPGSIRGAFPRVA